MTSDANFLGVPGEHRGNRMRGSGGPPLPLLRYVWAVFPGFVRAAKAGCCGGWGSPPPATRLAAPVPDKTAPVAKTHIVHVYRRLVWMNVSPYPPCIICLEFCKISVAQLSRFHDHRDVCDDWENSCPPCGIDRLTKCVSHVCLDEC